MSEPVSLTAAQWRQHVERCRASGLKIKAYSKQHGLKYSVLHYQYRKAYPIKKHSKLIPVQLKPGAESSISLCRIELQNGHAISVHDASLLPSILQALLS